MQIKEQNTSETVANEKGAVKVNAKIPKERCVYIYIYIYIYIYMYIYIYIYIFDTSGTCNTNNQIKFDFSNAYLIVKGIIAVA